MIKLSKTIEERILDPRESALRVSIASESFFNYCRIYCGDKFILPPALFHHEIFNSLSGVKKFIAIMGFRGSAKSTILEAFAEWTLVTQRVKFTIWIGATGNDSEQSIGNIRSSIESNLLLKNDFSITLDKQKDTGTKQWTNKNLQIKGCLVTARSRGAKNIRGTKFGNERVGLIIVDDLENTDSTRTKESREKTRNWFFSEVVPATKQGVLGDDVKVIMLGNLVHRDCLISYLVERPDIVEVIKFSLFGGDGKEKLENITWPALYPTIEAIQEEKKKVMLSGAGMGNIIWQREYLLQLVDEEDQIIKQEDIVYYDDSWLQRPKIRGGVGVDLAISEKSTADYTAMTKGVMVENDYGEQRLLIMKNNVKDRMDFSSTIQRAKDIKFYMPEGTVFGVEDVGYQRSAIQVMERNGLPVVPMKVTKDKRSRLVAVSSYIKSGMVMFPKNGADDIIEELLGFGIDEHDDQVDSLIHLINLLLNTETVFFA